MRYLSLLGFPRDDPLIRPLIVSGLESARRLAPRRHGMAPAGSFAFAATVRVIHGIHRDTTVVRHLAKPSSLPGLPVGFILMLDVAHLPDGGHAFHRHPANLTGGQL